MLNKCQTNIIEQTRPNDEFIPEIALSMRLLTMAKKPQSDAKTGLTPPQTMDKIISRSHLIAVTSDTEQSISSPKYFSWPLASLKPVKNGKLTKYGGITNEKNALYSLTNNIDSQKRISHENRFAAEQDEPAYWQR